MDYRKNLAKDEDARAKGNSTAIASADAAMQKNQFDYAALERQQQELGIKNLQAAATIAGTEATQAKLPVDIYNAESQRKHNESMQQYYKRMADAAALRASNVEDKDEKLMAKVDRLINTDPEYKTQMALITAGTISPGTPDYEAAMDRMDAVRKRYLKRYKLEDYYVPRDTPAVPPKPKEEPGFFQGLKGIFSKPADEFARKPTPIKLD